MTVTGTVAIPKQPAPWKLEHFRQAKSDKKFCACGRAYAANDRHARCQHCRKNKIVKCGYCGDEFRAPKDETQYCSRSCATRARHA